MHTCGDVFVENNNGSCCFVFCIDERSSVLFSYAPTAVVKDTPLVMAASTCTFKRDNDSPSEDLSNRWLERLQSSGILMVGTAPFCSSWSLRGCIIVSIICSRATLTITRVVVKCEARSAKCKVLDNTMEARTRER